MICSKCDHRNNDDAKFCRNCGEVLQRRSCDNGHTIPEGLSSCPYCPQNRPGTIAEAPGAATAALVAGGGAAGGRKGTVVVSDQDLAQSGVQSPQRPSAGIAASAPRGGAPAKPRAKGTMFMDPDAAPAGSSDDSGEGAGAPAPGSVHVSGMAVERGASRLVGFLVSFSLDKNGVFWPLRVGRTRLGAAEESDVFIPNPQISGSHATIVVRETKKGLRIYCQDEKSQNGTLLNGDDICQDTPDIGTGDVLQLGPVGLKLILLP